jgi:primosomal protein N' (replication factor Y)
MRREGPPRGKFISPRLAEMVGATLARGEQALLFLNRRGYAPLTLCRSCGFRMQCPNCDAWLVDHRFKRRLVCHHCGFSTPPPAECPHCHATDSLAAIGPGVERLEQEAAELFPQARILVLSSDMVESVERLRQELEDVAAGRFDLIVGTQLVAKGHHFPKLNLVGIVDADLGLGNGDPRAAERTFQLLHQVVGRAGREEGRGVGYLQTHQPEHPVMRALISGDREAFYKNEIEQRERTAYPPFGRLASLVVTANERHAAEAYGRTLAGAAPKNDDVRVLGPAEAPIAVVRGRHRFRLLVKAARAFDLSAYVREWLNHAPKPRGNVRLEVDIDPQSFY